MRLLWDRYEGPPDPRLVSLLIIGSGNGGGGGGGITNAFDALQTINDADANVAGSATKNCTITLLGLTADHTATMPGSPNAGQRFTFVDGDGTLGSGFTWTIAGNGKTINGLADFVLAAGTIGASPGGGIGPRGSITLLYNGTDYEVVG